MASADFYVLREIEDADGNKTRFLERTGEIKGRSTFGGFKAKHGEMELEYTPGLKVPDILPSRV